MKKAKINGKSVVLYDSIEELPILRYMAFNRQALIDADIGSDIEAFYRRIATVRDLLTVDPKKADQELVNLAQTVQLTMSSTSLVSKCYAHLIYSIDGKRLPDELNDDDMQSVYDLVTKRAKQSTIASYVLEVKKKLRSRLRTLYRHVKVKSM